MSINKFFLLICLFAANVSLTGQLSADCNTSTPIVDSVYDLPVISFPSNNIPDEINPSTSCLSGGEINGLWFDFQINSSCLLWLNVVPYDTSMQFNWALYDLTNNICSDIYTTSSLEVLCGHSGQISSPITVTAGQFFKLLITNNAGSTAGYKIDFSGSGCNFNSQVNINENNSINKIRIGPNPTSGSVNIDFDKNIIGEIISIRITDIHGKVIRERSIDLTHLSTFDISNEAPGVYFMQVITPKENFNFKVILQ